jgi:thymidine kinase
MNTKSGKLHLYTGPMFSGKSSELIRRFQDISTINKLHCIYVKPSNDTRDPIGTIQTHNGDIQTDVFTINKDIPSRILDIINNIYNDRKIVLFIDEIQFFNSSIIDTINSILQMGYDIYTAGLRSDYIGKPFETISLIIAIADEVVIKNSICVHEGHNGGVCGEPAMFSQMFINDKPVTEYLSTGKVFVGGKEQYKTFCREHYLDSKKNNNPVKDRILENKVCIF